MPTRTRKSPLGDVTKTMQKEDIVYHLTGMGEAGMDALGAAIAISDVNEKLTNDCTNAGVRCTDLYIDYFLT